MIKIDGVDIPRIEYIDPVDGKVSILRVMKDGVQIWPSDTEPLQIPTGITLREVFVTKPNIPTGIQLGEYDIIDWDFTQFEAGVNDNNTLVGMVVKDGILDMSSVPDETDFEVKINGSPVTPTGLSMSTTYIRLTVAQFGSSDVLTVSYTPGIDPVKGDDGVLLSSLIDQPLTNILEPLQIPTGITLREVTPYTYLLDDYPGAAAAYSLRKLRTGAVQGIMVRRDSDDQLVDVRLYDDPSKSIDLDSITESGGQTLGDWVGGASAYVFNWYDQSGSGNHASQTDDTLQLPIIESGILVVDSDNGLSALKSTDNNRLDVTLNIPSALTTFNVFNRNALGDGGGGIWGQAVNAPNILTWFRATDIMSYRAQDGANSDLNSATAPQPNLSLVTTIASAGNQQLFNNNMLLVENSSFGTFTPFNDVIYLTHYNDGVANGLKGVFQEFIFYLSDQSANRIAIETNINDFYNIYVVTAEVDAQLIQADNDNVSDTVIEINGVRSSASDMAVANLISRNVTVITN